LVFRPAVPEVDKIASQSGETIAQWHLHDFRRTCATYLAKLGTDRIVISKILNHAEGGVTGIYERHRQPRSSSGFETGSGLTGFRRQQCEPAWLAKSGQEWQ
jgi:integrase